MSELEFRVEGAPASPTEEWSLRWLDSGRGIAQVYDAGRVMTVLVEGSGSDWVVTLRGRRLAVTAQTWRERTFAAAAATAGVRAGPIQVAASLPGLVVAVSVAVRGQVAEGDPLVTIEAMKMQNEIRAPRAGTVAELQVIVGQRVAAGDPILRLE